MRKKMSRIVFPYSTEHVSSSIYTYTLLHTFTYISTFSCYIFTGASIIFITFFALHTPTEMNLYKSISVYECVGVPS